MIASRKTKERGSLRWRTPRANGAGLGRRYPSTARSVGRPLRPERRPVRWFCRWIRRGSPAWLSRCRPSSSDWNDFNLKKKSNRYWLYWSIAAVGLTFRGRIRRAPRAGRRCRRRAGGRPESARPAGRCAAPSASRGVWWAAAAAAVAWGAPAAAAPPPSGRRRSRSPAVSAKQPPPPQKKNKNKQTKNKQNNITKRASVVHSQWCGVLLLFLFMYSHFYSFADLSTANPLLKSIHSTNRHINNRYLTLIDWHFLMYSHSYSFADLSTANPLLKSICSKNRHLNNRYLPIMDTTTKHRVLCIILARTIFQKRHSTFLYSHSYSFADLSTANPLLKSMYSKNWHIHNRYLPITDTTAKHRVLCIILARTIVR